MIENLRREARTALRQLLRNPGFTLVAMATLALGIGANSTIFSWIRATLLNPVPGATADTGRMVALQVGERNEHPTPPLSYPDYVDLRGNATSLSGLLAYHDDSMSLTGGGKPERIYGALVTANYFRVLGVRAALGRTLAESEGTEAAGQAEVVLGYDLWRNRFGGDPRVLGRVIEINLHPYTIVGVAPKGFQGCKTGLRADAWIPVGMDPQMWGSHRIAERGQSWLNVLGMLAPGVSREQAENQLNVAMQRIAERYATTHRGNNRVSLDPLWRSPFGANVYLAGTLPMLLALAAVLLLLACANVANLLLVRSAARRRELAIRLSMGASRWRLVRELMIESVLLALGAGIAAVLLTLWTARMLGAMLPSATLPINLNGHVDGAVWLTTMAVALLTAGVAGAMPALRASSVETMSILKDEALSTSGGLGRSRLTAGLVVAQVALSLVLLTCAGLFVRSLHAAQQTDIGFDPNHVLLATFNLDPLGTPGDKGVAFDQDLLARLRGLPGVQAATLADFSPLSFTIHSDGALPEGYVPRPHESMEMDRGVVGPQYLTTLRTPLVAGRDFTDADRAGTQPVAIVNQAFVDRYWPKQNAIGKRILFWETWRTVVGVAANGKYRRLVYDPTPLILVPLWQEYRSEAIVHLRVAGDPLAMTAAVEQTVEEMNPDLPLYNVATLKSNLRIGDVFERIAVDFAASFGLLALLLATVGLYGVVAYTTRQRTHEIGIRMALGAERGTIFRDVVARGLWLTGTGAAIGVVVSLLVTRFLRSLLFGVGADDLATYAAVVVLLGLVAAAACYLPAWRATKIDPMAALRHE